MCSESAIYNSTLYEVRLDNAVMLISNLQYIIWVFRIKQNAMPRSERRRPEKSPGDFAQPGRRFLGLLGYQGGSKACLRFPGLGF